MARRQFLEQLVELSTDAERAIVFSSHIVSDIERLANRIWILKEGHLFWQGDLDSLKETVVRLHVRGQSRAGRRAPTAQHPGRALIPRRGGVRQPRVVRDWTSEAQRSLEKLASGTIEVEPLGLEDIFLELHR